MVMFYAGGVPFQYTNTEEEMINMKRKRCYCPIQIYSGILLCVVTVLEYSMRNCLVVKSTYCHSNNSAVCIAAQQTDSDSHITLWMQS